MFFAKVCRTDEETEKRGYVWAHAISTNHQFEVHSSYDAPQKEWGHND